MFLGYSPTQRGYKCYTHTTHKLVVTRDVRFDEHTSYYSSSNEIINQGESSSSLFPLPTPVVEAYCPEQSYCNVGMDIHTDPIPATTEGADL
jgi:hypothetical protein